MSDAREFDVLLWGATGFTGQLVAEYLAEHYGVDGEKLRWAMAGRNLQKLERVRSEIAAKFPGTEAIALFTGDSNDLDSLQAIAAKTKVICTTVGPYAKYGPKMVEACVAEGTHYCDLTGEVQFIHRMIEAHHEAAKEKKLRITNCCGYDSIPSDLGTLIVQEAMKERHGVYCSEVKYFAGPTSGTFSGGTVASMMHMMDEAKDKQVRKILGDPYALYPAGAARGLDGSDQMGVRWDKDFGCWTAPFMMAGINTRVVRRSNALMGFKYGEDFRYSEVMSTPKGVRGWLMAQSVKWGFGFFMVLSVIKPTRKLLGATVLPKPGEGPSPKAQREGHFTTYLIGKAGEHKLHGLIKGFRDPGYGSTAIMLAESAICLAQDQDALPQEFGVVTPATAMGMTLVQRLRNAGLTLDVNEEFKSK